MSSKEKKPKLSELYPIKKPIDLIIEIANILNINMQTESDVLSTFFQKALINRAKELASMNEFGCEFEQKVFDLRKKMRKGE